MRCLVILLLGALPLAAQTLEVTGPVPAAVTLGEAARIELIAVGVEEDAGLVLGPLPAVDDVRLVSARPERRTRTVERGGRSVDVAGLAWTIEVRPLRTGSIPLGAFSIVGRGVTLTTKPLSLRVTAPPPSELPVRLDVIADRESCFVGESIRLSLRLRFDPRFMRDEAIQPFRSRLDVPVQVTARLLEKVPGAAVRAVPSAGGGFCAVNGDLIEVGPGEPVEVDGRTWHTVLVERIVTPSRPGALDLGAPFVRVLHAGEFSEDFFGRRRPGNQRDVVIAGATPDVTVRGIPEQGRPAEFDGALGTFRVEAESELSEVVVGESFSVFVSVRGRGALETASVPRLESPRGFHVLGVLDGGVEAGMRLFVIDLAVRDASVTELPAFVLHSFNPAREIFVTARSEPIALVVRPAAAGEGAEADAPPAPTAGVDDVHTELEPVRGDPARAPAAAVALGAVSPWLLIAGWLVIRRRREASSRDPLARGARRAAAGFRRAVRRGVDPREAFVDYLAARFRKPRPAVVAFEFGDDLVAAGVDRELAAATCDVVFESSAARFGVTKAGGDHERIAGLVASLETFAAGGGRP